MFGNDPLSRHDRSEADQLHDYLDDLAAGVLAPRGPIDHELAATAAEIDTAGRQSHAPAGLKTQVWEELMSVSALPGNRSRPPRARSIDVINQPAIPSMATHQRPSQRRNLVWLAMAALALLTLAGGIIFSGNDDGGNQQFGGVIPAPMSASPEASPGDGKLTPEQQARWESLPIVDPAGCTAPTMLLTEIAGVLASANHRFYDPEWQSGAANYAAPVFAQETPVVTDTVVPEADQAAITQVYEEYLACTAAGSVRQRLSLFTPSGVARELLNTNGEPIWGDVVALGVAPTPVAAGAIRDFGIASFEMLDDGRVLVGTGNLFSDEPVRFMIFVKVGEDWRIDATYCNSCG